MVCPVQPKRCDHFPAVHVGIIAGCGRGVMPAESHTERDERRRPTRDEIRELLLEEFPTLPIAKHPPTLSERIGRAEVEVERLKKIVAKRKAAKP
jgi:hypothetical protein